MKAGEIDGRPIAGAPPFSINLASPESAIKPGVSSPFT